MKYAHIVIAVAAFGMLSAGWWVGKVDTTTYVTLAVATVTGTAWMNQNIKSTTTPTITPPATPAPPAPTPANTENPKP